jgi:hypothetical protein
MTLQYFGEIPSNSAIVAAAEQIAVLFHSRSPGPTTVEIAAVIGANLRAARSKATTCDRSDNRLSRSPGYRSTYAWAYLAHETERRDYHANTIARMCPDDPDRHLKEEKQRSLANFARILARDILASPTDTLGEMDARAWLLLLETCPDHLPEAARRGDINALPTDIRIKNYAVSEVGIQAAVDIALAILRASANPHCVHRSS